MDEAHGGGLVGYHERTVLGRGDDPVSSALDCYASRGETLMEWRGAGAASLGLSGEVNLDDWRAVFGTGGARHPENGERLVHCMRPGMELVASCHKSIAELGVIGRAEDMHKILDTEREATVAYLDKVVQEQGGRRGRAQVRTPTDGLTWAVSRHATTRSGDPQAHDTFCLPTFFACETSGEAGRRSTPASCVTTSTLLPPYGAWPPPPRPSSSVTPSRPTPGRWPPRCLGHRRHPQGGLGSSCHPLGPHRRRRRRGRLLPLPGHCRPGHPGP
jgi:TrwC relaxase